MSAREDPIGPRPTAAPDMASDEHRMTVLGSYEPDSLEGDPELKALTDFAAKLCGTPIALVSLVEIERQRFLARTGLEARETPRDTSFCAHAMLLGSVMEVPDARRDQRFAANPLVLGAPGIRFYAGQPLVSEEGTPLGALCVIDSTAREQGLTDFQREGLAVLGQAVMRRLRARRDTIASQREQQLSEERFRALADSLPDIAWSADETGRIDYFNRRWRAFTGLDRHLAVGDGAALIHPDDYAQVHEGWKDAVRDGTSYEAENRLRRADGVWRWMLVRAEPVFDEDSRAVRWFGTMTDIDDTHKLSEQRDLLARELSHRIKNIFAVVAGLISLLSRKKPEYREFSGELTATIQALGRAHDYVRPGGARQGSLHGILEDLFSPYLSDGQQRVTVTGDDVPIAAQAATPLALVFHELATNSAKYGALLTGEGTIALTIEDQGENLLLRWVERGGPAPEASGAPTEGFGSRLVEMSVKGQLGGSWERRFEHDGLIVELTVSKQAIAP